MASRTRTSGGGNAPAGLRTREGRSHRGEGNSHRAGRQHSRRQGAGRILRLPRPPGGDYYAQLAAVGNRNLTHNPGGQCRGRIAMKSFSTWIITALAVLMVP